MLDQSSSQDFECALHTIAELLSNPAPFLDPLRVVTLQQTLVRFNSVTGEARRVKQAVENDKLTVGVPLDHGLNVELQVRGLGEPCTVSQQSEFGAVGDHTPKGLGAVEEVLDQSVWSPARWPSLIEWLVNSDDMDRRSVLRAVSAVGDRKGSAPGFDGGALVL